MKRSISLNQTLSCEQICKCAENLVNSFIKVDPHISECILVMEIVRPTDEISKAPVAIEYKESSG